MTQALSTGANKSQFDPSGISKKIPGEDSSDVLQQLAGTTKSKNISKALSELVLSYLLANCYEETAYWFAKSVAIGKDEQNEEFTDFNGKEGSMDLDSHNPAARDKCLNDETYYLKELEKWLELAVSSNHLSESHSSATDDISTSPINVSTPSRSSISRSAEYKPSSHRNNDRNLIPMAQSLKKRKLIKTLVIDGKILEAIDMINLNFPGLLKSVDSDDFLEKYKLSEGSDSKNGSSLTLDESSSNAQSWPTSSEMATVPPNPESDDLYPTFQILCQQFIELVRGDQQAEALSFAQNTLGKFGLVRPAYLRTLRDIVALIAYQNPYESPVSGFLEPNRRQFVAETINSWIVWWVGGGWRPTLERIVEQVFLVNDELKRANSTTDKSKTSASDDLAAAMKAIYGGNTKSTSNSNDSFVNMNLSSSENTRALGSRNLSDLLNNALFEINDRSTVDESDITS